MIGETALFFQLDKNQIKKLEKEYTEHKCTVNNTGAIGGKITFSFTPTDLGTVVKVKCACGFEVDLTDYEDW